MSIYKFAALVENGNADIRTLTIAQLSKYQLRVKVEAGSSSFQDNARELLEALARAAFEKMDGKQIVIAVLGLALIGGTTWGALSYIEANKEMRLAEIGAEERGKIIADLTAASSEQTKLFREVLDIMRDSGDLPKRTENTADKMHSDRLRTAAQVDETVIGDVHISGEQARELRASKRRKSVTRYVTQEMKVVDVNTADPQHTTIVLVD